MGNLQRLVEVVFWHMIDDGNVVNRHPWLNSAYIASKYHLTSLLKALESLNGGYGGDNRTSEREA